MLKKLMVGLAVLSMLTGCGPVKVPDVKLYQLGVIPSYSTLKSPIPTNRTLLVSNTVASAGFRTRDMLYVSKPYQLMPFAKHGWVSPPAEMIAPLLVQKLQSLGLFKAVVSPPFVGKTYYRLDTRLLALNQVFLTEQSFVQLSLQVSLTDTVRSVLIGSKRFSIRVDAKDNTPYAGVIATNKAVNELLNQITAFCVQKI